MRVFELAKRRKTVRQFLPDKPSLDAIMKALEAAKEAPSGMNAQPWRFVVIDDEWLKGKIRELCEEEEKKFYSKTKGDLMAWLNAKGFRPEKPFLSEAPYLILVFGHTKAPYWLQSTWIAVGYLLLALEELGLGTVTYTPPNPKPVEELLNAPRDYKLQVILPVGYPADPKPKYERKRPEEVMSLNGF
ncbi:nitroreductase family protein [Thermococcus sp. GR7]|uniref:nitroreductase family protein n=1 Tax=unclassified Thermococcus TaxID=2627626 RepID=UPI00142FAD74|nr:MULTISPECIES: nitroreductase family protein [unclassified Thermococcus]NJE47456.1 nitroreductase family protein [Thermococcus sp. GR7]NJE78616.1 nitroreductase family protein [Thermococcus sp. GR4]NJF23506.1 nitroreductase family protein [Thermococcus sp. GR5]